MKAFAALFEKLDQTTKTNERIRALAEYLANIADADRLWCIALLSGKRPKRVVNAAKMKEWAADLANIPMWLFEESYHVVGDMSETISLLLPNVSTSNDRSLAEWMELLSQLAAKEEDQKRAFVLDAWHSLNSRERFVFNKLIGGSFRVGVSQKTMVKALSRVSGKTESELAHRLMGKWTPQTHTYQSLVMDETGNEDLSKPYPFYLAYALDEHVDLVTNADEWIAERKWDGIRGQVIKRGGEVFVWTRGEELVTEKYPELQELRHVLPDGVALDGEILPFKDGKPLSFNELQRRIGRKVVGKKLLNEVPVKLIAYDLLEANGNDIRTQPLSHRRSELEQLVAVAAHPNLIISEMLVFSSFADLAALRDASREHLAEGLMLKQKASTYRVGRKRGDWWKWKVEPLVIDAVLIYAMRGHGRRANLYTDYTFAVWDAEQLVPFTKAYSGLTDEEFRQVDRFVKSNIIEKFGPVRSVTPELVFEIAFEGIAKSSRHKSGISLRFPRMSRWRKDKSAAEANTLADLQALLAAYG